MSVVVSFRVSRELKEKMDRLRGIVNWSEELRRFVEERVRELEQQQAIEEIEELIKKLPRIPSGTTEGYVRRDRDSY